MSSLKRKTVVELKQLAKKRNLTGYSKMDRKKLIQLLSKSDDSASSSSDDSESSSSDESASSSSDESADDEPEPMPSDDTCSRLQNYFVAPVMFNKGSSSELFEGCTDKDFKTCPYAIKKQRYQTKVFEDDGDENPSEKEYRLYQKLSALDVVPRFHNGFRCKEDWYLVTDRVRGFTLKGFISRLDDEKNPMQALTDIYTKLSGKISRMHKAGIVHNDLHIRNVLIGFDRIPWIIDAGWAQEVKAPAKGKKVENDRKILKDIREFLEKLKAKKK